MLYMNYDYWSCLPRIWLFIMIKPIRLCECESNNWKHSARVFPAAPTVSSCLVFHDLDVHKAVSVFVWLTVEEWMMILFIIIRYFPNFKQQQPTCLSWHNFTPGPLLRGRMREQLYRIAEKWWSLQCRHAFSKACNAFSKWTSAASSMLIRKLMRW